MLKFFRRKKDNGGEEGKPPETAAPDTTPVTTSDPLRETSEADQKSSLEQPSEAEQEREQKQQEKQNPSVEEKRPSSSSWFGRLKASLHRTRTNFTEGLANLFLGKKEIDQALLENLETHLLKADVGVATTQRIMQTLTAGISRKAIKDPAAVFTALQQTLTDILRPCESPLSFSPAQSNPKPFVILMIGVNGAGKTTTIGKLAKKYQANHHSVMLAAGDTFRAAAIEQLQIWGERNQVPVLSQHTGADSASVIFDAFQSAKAKNIEVLIADTAGRLHTRENLMDELKKVKRVMQKLDASAPHEVMLVLDAGTGQNALAQALKFHEALGVTGITLTKLDGTAKGGIIFSIADQLKLPIRFIGVGEKIEDLRPFQAEDFVKALFDQQDTEQAPSEK